MMNNNNNNTSSSAKRYSTDDDFDSSPGVGDPYLGKIHLSAKDAIQDCVRFGKCYKKGNNRSGLKEWRQRVLVLTFDGKLYYYKTVKDKEYLGVINVKDCIIKRCDTEVQKKYAFKIEGIDKNRPEKAFYAYCLNEKEVGEWLIALTNASGSCLIVSQDATEQQLKTNRWFKTISEAIAAALSGEKIKVYAGLYREQLVIDKVVVIEGVVSEDIIKRQNELKVQYERELRKKEMLEKESRRKSEARKEDIKRSLSIRDSVDIVKQQQELAKQQDLIQQKLRGMTLRQSIRRNSGSPTSEDPSSPVRSHTRVRSTQRQTMINLMPVPQFIKHGNISEVILEGPSNGEAPIIYKSTNGTISNMTIRMNTESPQLNKTHKKLEDLASSEEDSMISCIEVDNGSLNLLNCTVRCNSGSGILCMNKSHVHIQNCDISEIRDVGIWTWDRSSLHVVESKISIIGVDGIHLNGHSKVKLERCTINGCGLFGICAVDSSECLIQTCEISRVNADALRVQNSAKCQVRISELRDATEYGIGVYNQLDNMSISITEDCKFIDNKLGDFSHRHQVRLEN